MDSVVKHELASSAYNNRRESCENVVKEIKKKHPEEINLSADNVSPSFKAYMELAFNEGNKAMLTIRIEGMGTKP
ncbi:hypothetical protein CLI75_12390, partial [Porphyromonas gingivalis]